MEINIVSTKPVASVIIPNYNHSAFLKQRIKSVLTQSINEIECIILDDASDDHSGQIIAEFTSSDERVEFYPSAINSGSTFIQWNKGINLATTELVWIAESDDLATIEFLEELSNPFKTDNDVVLAYCQSYRMNDKEEITGDWKDFTDDRDKDLFKNNFIMDGKEYIERFLIRKNSIPNASAVLFRKVIYDKVGGAPVELKTNGDWLTWLKMLCYGKVAFIAKPMNYFRYHDKSVIARAMDEKSTSGYKEQYDQSLRIAFKQFVEDKQIKLSRYALKINDHFISLDTGNEGLFQLTKGNILKGWKKITLASFYPSFKSGFIKKALGL